MADVCVHFGSFTRVCVCVCVCVCVRVAFDCRGCDRLSRLPSAVVIPQPFPADRASMLLLLLLSVVGCCCRPSMPPRRRALIDAPPVADGSLERKLAMCGTRTGMADALGALHAAGWLKDSVVEGQVVTGLRRRIRSAIREHSSAITPYGTVVQHMSLPTTKLPLWEYCHPMALLYHLSVISSAFGHIMGSV